jgi:hypothetical protein
MVDHADTFGKIFAALAAILGFAATYYTFRIQRSVWSKMKSNPNLIPPENGL